MGERTQPTGGVQLLALLLAGLAGGAAGGLLVGSRTPAAAATGPRPAAPASEVAADSGAEAVRELARLVEVLIDEVRDLRVAPARREPAPPSEPDQLERLAAAVEELARSLATQATLRGTGPGAGTAAPLSTDASDVPRSDRLLELRAHPTETMVRPHLFWTRQQVLDHFGPPELFDGLDQWLYPDPGADDERVHLEFLFDQGLLIQIGRRLVLG